MDPAVPTEKLMETELMHSKGKEADDPREATIELLRICNKAGTLMELMRDLMLFFQRLTGCEAVGVRMRQGEDFPYYETRGFPGEFVLAENRLCTFDQQGELVRDCSGHPALDCMCGNVLCGRFDPSKSFFTPRGSFWSSSTTELLASTSDADRQAKTRNRCNGEGYESVALVPLQSQGETFGLFQFNDKRGGRFTAEKIALLEELVTYVAIGVAKRKTDEALRSREESYRSLFENMAEGYAYCRVIFDGDRPVDFIFLNVNNAFGTLTGLKDVVGKKVSEVIPGIRESDPWLFEIHGRVASTGKPGRFEIYVEALNHWFSISVYSPKKDHFVAVFDVITERKRAESALRESEYKYRQILESTGEAIYGIDLAGRCTVCNPSLLRLLGYRHADDVLGKDMHELIHHTRPDGTHYPVGECRIIQSIRNRAGIHVDDEVFWRADGTNFHAEYWSHPQMKGDEVVGAVVAFVDITERRSLEKQLRQAQKMEAVGTLAGGIAHDFNNSLTGILGFAELLRKRLSGDEQGTRDLGEILRCAERASRLTRQLLAYARRQVIEPVNLNLNAVTADLMKLLCKVMGEDIEIAVLPASDLSTIRADRGQLEQVLMNLCLNARDAMPEGGKLVVETENVCLDEEYVRHNPFMKTGSFALLKVSDTGIGMDEQTRERVFEPFFTTKGPDNGTGLGLAMVYGIVKQHDGFINLYSEPGSGTTFKVYFPAYEAPVEDAPDRFREEPVRGGNEIVLLAEDEESIRKFAERTLKELGYNVLIARNGEEAIEIFSRNKDVVLAVLDVVMPLKGGKDAFEEMKKENPRLKGIFMSGYSPNSIHQSFVLTDGVPFLQKPFGPTILARKIREVLDTHENKVV